MNRKPLIIAHRGASLESQENTLTAYRKAIEIGADWIELDVHLAKNGVPVCHHDAQLTVHEMERPVLLSDYTSVELKSMMRGQCEIPTLDEVLELDRGQTGLMVELKDSAGIPLVHAVQDCLSRSPCPNILLGSFSLEIMHELCQTWPLQQLVGIVENAGEIPKQRALNIAHLAVDVNLLTPPLLRTLRQANLEVWVWTVDDPKVAALLCKAGVQGIITNDPRRMRAALH